MGTSLLLRSHDCLQGHDAALSLTPSPIRSQRNPNRSPSPDPYQTRRRSLHGGGGSRSGMVAKGPGANLVMGQVKILKRGETLSPENNNNNNNNHRTTDFDDGGEAFDLALGSTNRLGPDPSSVPVPGFITLRR